MKKSFLVSFFLCVSFFALTSTSMASTSCTISISGPSGHGYSYEVLIEVIDLWGGPPPTVVYNSGWISGSVGSYSYGIPYDVVPDCKDRWAVQVTCRQLYNGVTISTQGPSFTGPWSSDEYNDPANLIYSFSF